MKNVKLNQLKKCILLTQTEMENILSEILQEIVTVNVGVHGLDYCTEEDREDLDNSYLCAILSDYFDVSVTSVHVDACGYVGIWIVYKDKEEN